MTIAQGGTYAPLVLLVDDSALVTEALGILLEASGYRCATAGSVAEARGALAAERFSAILLDLTLPDGDGLSLLADRATTAPVPTTIALTGHDDPDTARRCRDAGCAAVLVKPVRPAAVLAALRTAGIGGAP